MEGPHGKQGAFRGCTCPRGVRTFMRARIVERKDVKGKDTFSLPEWWRCNSGSLPHFSFVLRVLLTNAPNSCPPERLFSMFNATFGEDQRRAFGDYDDLAM
jgi:hypothetical protein